MSGSKKRSNKSRNRMSPGQKLTVFTMTAGCIGAMGLIILDRGLFEPAIPAATGIVILLVLLLILNSFIRKLLQQLDEAFDRIEFMTIMDDLTHLYNRKHFSELTKIELSRARRYQRSLSCLMLGIDNFKRINEQYGRLCGDMILKEVAEVLRDNSRITDVIARDHGDKFVCLFPETDFEATFYLAKRLLAIVETSEFLYGDDFKTLQLTTSIGITACKPGIDKNIDSHQIINMADKALETAKINGRNRIEYFIGQ
ncbi:MAG: hypothetical protein A2W28_10855 [Gammaproteobacteria bacterium RBG_16_51_14]|nr:MAG: hypothetical protein A2W28_10855 [Gammaproteobacteria bacterium RBG_16_51_14]